MINTWTESPAEDLKTKCQDTHAQKAVDVHWVNTFRERVSSYAVKVATIPRFTRIYSGGKHQSDI